MTTGDPSRIGTVRDVRGATVSAQLSGDSVAGLSFIDGQGYRLGQVGSFVRIPMGYVDLFGIVSQVGAGAVPERLAIEHPHGDRWMTVQLAGEADRKGAFRRGLSQYPTVGDAVHLVAEHDLARIYGRPNEPNFVRIGHLASADSIPALVDVNKLVTRHCAVVGATGSGKSTTVAGLLATLSNGALYPSARILVLDLHGEYGRALADRAHIFRVGQRPGSSEESLHIPYWAMTFDELMSVTFGSLDDASRGAVLEKIVQLKTEALSRTRRTGISRDNLTIDSPVPFSIHRLWFDLHCLVNSTHTAPGSGQSESTVAYELDPTGKPVEKGNALRVMPPRYRPQTLSAGAEKIYLSASPLNIRRPLELFASRLRDPRFDFLFRPGPWSVNEAGIVTDDLDTLVSSWIGGDRPISILDISGVPVSVATSMVGALLRIIYDALFWSRDLSEGGRERPILIVLEEAHSYLAPGDENPAGRIMRRIVKEGRKYGIGAMIVSQRPAEVDATILSQCGTMIALRLSNATDRGHVSSSVSDSLDGLMSMLPILRTGEAIVVGEAVHIPLRALIDAPLPDRRPDSNDPLIYNTMGPGGWDRERPPSDYTDVVRAWRSQDPRSPRILTTDSPKGLQNEP